MPSGVLRNRSQPRPPGRPIRKRYNGRPTSRTYQPKRGLPMSPRCPSASSPIRLSPAGPNYRLRAGPMPRPGPRSVASHGRTAPAPTNRSPSRTSPPSLAKSPPYPTPRPHRARARRSGSEQIGSACRKNLSASEHGRSRWRCHAAPSGTIRWPTRGPLRLPPVGPPRPRRVRPAGLRHRRVSRWPVRPQGSRPDRPIRRPSGSRRRAPRLPDRAETRHRPRRVWPSQYRRWHSVPRPIRLPRRPARTG